MGRVIDLGLLRGRRQAVERGSSRVVFAWSPPDWPFCRVRCFVNATTSGRPPRCCCGQVYNRGTLRMRAPIFAGAMRKAMSELASSGTPSPADSIAALLARPELTSVERAALSTGPCNTCPVLTEQTQQLRFLRGLYRAYWGRWIGCHGARGQSADPTAHESRRSAIDLRTHIRREIHLIRHLQQQLALCPWARRRQLLQAGGSLAGC